MAASTITGGSAASALTSGVIWDLHYLIRMAIVSDERDLTLLRHLISHPACAELEN